MIPHAAEWITLSIITLVTCALVLGIIHWVMKGYQYDKFPWEKLDDE